MIGRQVDGIIYATLAAAVGHGARATCSASGSCCSTASTRRPTCPSVMPDDVMGGRVAARGPAGRRVSTEAIYVVGEDPDDLVVAGPGAARRGAADDWARRVSSSRAWCRATWAVTPAYDAVSALAGRG